MPGAKPRPVLDRFMEKVDRATSTCWLWTRALFPDGYGLFHVTVDGNRARRSQRAHRVSYELHRGPIPDGMVLDHLCQNKRCVNPAHLEVVSQEENARRGLANRVQKKLCVNGHEMVFCPNEKRRRCLECKRKAGREYARRKCQGLPSHPRSGTHCRRGHEFTPENTRILPAGTRTCRTCLRLNQRANAPARRAASRESSPGPRLDLVRASKGTQ